MCRSASSCRAGSISSLIAAVAAEASPDLTAFTVRVEGDNFDETPHAIAVARHIGLRHEIVELANCDLIEAFDTVSEKLSEPLGDSSLLPSYLVCRAARRRMTVALGGDGADELFAGYPNFPVQRFAPAMRLVPAALGEILGRAIEALPGAEGYMSRRFLLRQLSHGFGASPARQSFLWMAPFTPGRLAALWRHSALPEDALAAAFAPIDCCAADVAGLTSVDLLMYLFQLTYLPDDVLTKTDRASMFNGLEVRAPFLDRRFAEYACALSTRLKLHGRTRKYILKQVASAYLPEAVVQRQEARVRRADRHLDPHAVPRAVPRCVAVAPQPRCRLVRARGDRSAARRTHRRAARPRQKAVGALCPVFGSGPPWDNGIDRCDAPLTRRMR